MSEHPNVRVINRMTKAVFENDRETLADLLIDDMAFHLRGPLLGRATTRASTGSPASSERSGTYDFHVVAPSGAITKTASFQIAVS
jgi:hypothetical protein